MQEVQVIQAMQTINMTFIIFGAIMSALIMIRMATKPTSFILNLLIVLAALECVILATTKAATYVFAALLLYNFFKLVHGEHLKETQG